MRKKYKVTLLGIAILILLLSGVEAHYQMYKSEEKDLSAFIKVAEGLSINYLNGTDIHVTKRESEVAGKANILIFPDLNAGNIGVKLVQQFGHSSAYGPLLQGFRKICSDCSRGAPVDELVGNIVFSVVRAGEKQK